MAQNLQRANVDQGVNPLLQALRLEDQLARQREITEIFKEFDEDKQVSLLFAALLKSPESELRKGIVEELSKIGSDKAVELLGSIMTDDFDPEVQREAIEALRQIGSDKAIDALLSALRSSNEWLSQEAANALGDFKADRVVDSLVEASKHYYRAYTVVRSLLQIGSDRAIDALVKIIHDPMHLAGTTSYDALAGLVRLGTEKAIDEIFKAWNADDSIHRSRLFGILYQFKPKHLIAPLCQRLQSNS